eukprot:3777054-Prymnesium_polylepis.1
MLISAALAERADRRAVPLPFADRGGVVLRPSAVTLECLYGSDGGSYRLVDPAHPGCSDGWCDPRHLYDDNGERCGFSGTPATAWRPADLAALLREHAQHGARYTPPAFHS